MGTAPSSTSTTSTTSVEQTQQAKLDLCKSQLQSLTQSYDQANRIIQEQIRSANDQVKFTQDRLYKMQQDGGQAMKQLQNVTTQIDQYKLNIASKQQQLQVVQGQLNQLELECDKLEKELQSQKSIYEQCMQNQGLFTTNQEIMVALGNVLVTSTAVALITRKMLN